MTEEDEEFNRIEREAAMRKGAVKATVAPREWAGLTDEEIAELHYELKVRFTGTYTTEDIYRVVEAALREKNA